MPRTIPTTAATVTQLSGDALLAELDKVRAELATSQAEATRLKTNRPTGKITLKVSPKGAVSAYGLGRWPVTLYSSQWISLLDQVDQVRAFLETHRGELAHKN